MVIDIVVPLFKPFVGGLENATFNLAKEMCPGNEVNIHTFNLLTQYVAPRLHRFSADLPEKEVIAGINVFRYPCYCFPIIRLFSPALMKAIWNSQARIVHIQGFQTIYNGFFVQKLAKMRGKKTVLTAHSLYEGLEIVNRHLFRKIFLWILAHVYLMGFDKIILLSNLDVQVLQQLNIDKKKLAVIPNGLDVTRFESRMKTVTKDNSKKILCVGRFDVNKGHQDLIHAIALIPAEIDFIAYLVGPINNRPYFDSLNNLIRQMSLQDKVRVCNSVTDSQLAEYYFNSDIFVLPSRMETFGLVILEAMYAGLPIVATRVGGIPDLIVDGENGFLVAPGNPEQLKDRILTLLGDAALCQNFSRKNKDAAKRFNWTAISQRTLSLYRSLLNSR
jgi:glycosyltransferase involved in cell wall biosynthesis